MKDKEGLIAVDLVSLRKMIREAVKRKVASHLDEAGDFTPTKDLSNDPGVEKFLQNVNATDFFTGKAIEMLKSKFQMDFHSALQTLQTFTAKNSQLREELEEEDSMPSPPQASSPAQAAAPKLEEWRFAPHLPDRGDSYSKQGLLRQELNVIMHKLDREFKNNIPAQKFKDKIHKFLMSLRGPDFAASQNAINDLKQAGNSEELKQQSPELIPLVQKSIELADTNYKERFADAKEVPEKDFGGFQGVQFEQVVNENSAYELELFMNEDLNYWQTKKNFLKTLRKLNESKAWIQTVELAAKNYLKEYGVSKKDSLLFNRATLIDVAGRLRK